MSISRIAMRSALTGLSLAIASQIPSSWNGNASGVAPFTTTLAKRLRRSKLETTESTTKQADTLVQQGGMVPVILSQERLAKIVPFQILTKLVLCTELALSPHAMVSSARLAQMVLFALEGALGHE